MFYIFQFLTGSNMDINKLYQYIITLNLINITIKNIAINTGRLWRRPVLDQSENVCTVAILNVQGDITISLCHERSLARRRALAFRRGALGRTARPYIVENTSDKLYLANGQYRILRLMWVAITSYVDIFAD